MTEQEKQWLKDMVKENRCPPIGLNIPPEYPEYDEEKDDKLRVACPINKYSGRKKFCECGDNIFAYAKKLLYIGA